MQQKILSFFHQRKHFLLAVVLFFCLTRPVQASGDCETTSTFKVMGLSCLKCAIKEYNNQEPSERWLALLAITTQQSYAGVDYLNSKSSPEEEEKAKTRFYRHLIEKISAYGYCLPDGMNEKGNHSEGKGYPDLVNMETDLRSVMISAANGNKKISRRDYSTVLSELGFSSVDSAHALMKIDNWSELSVGQRQAILQDFSPQIARGKKGEGLSRCFSQLQRQKQTKRFAIPGSVENIKFCRVLAEKCLETDSEESVSKTKSAKDPYQFCGSLKNTNVDLSSRAKSEVKPKLKPEPPVEDEDDDEGSK